MSKDLDEVAARLEAFADNENVPDTVKDEFLNAALQMTELLSTAVRLTSVNKMLNAQLTAAQSRAEHAEQEAVKIRQREVSLLMQWQEKVDAAQSRVAELEGFAKQLACLDMPPADDSKEWPWQNRLYAIRSNARRLMGMRDD